MATATVPAGAAGFLDDSYRYVPLVSSVTLFAGQQYRIAALFQSTSDPFNDPWDPDGDGNPANSPAVGDGVAVVPGSGVATMDGDYFAASATLVLPTNFGGGTPGRWGAANALFEFRSRRRSYCLACASLWHRCYTGYRCIDLEARGAFGAKGFFDCASRSVFLKM